MNELIIARKKERKNSRMQRDVDEAFIDQKTIERTID
jgi:hypothetical protein